MAANLAAAQPMRSAMQEQVALSAEALPAPDDVELPAEIVGGPPGSPEHDLVFDGEDTVFEDDEVSLADDDLKIEAPDADPHLGEMRDALQMLRDSEVSHALRELRQLFPDIPFPKRVRALMAVRHGAMAG